MGNLLFHGPGPLWLTLARDCCSQGSVVCCTRGDRARPCKRRKERPGPCRPWVPFRRLTRFLGAFSPLAHALFFFPWVPFPRRLTLICSLGAFSPQAHASTVGCYHKPDTAACFRLPPFILLAWWGSRLLKQLTQHIKHKNTQTMLCVSGRRRLDRPTSAGGASSGRPGYAGSLQTRCLNPPWKPWGGMRVS